MQENISKPATTVYTVFFWLQLYNRYIQYLYSILSSETAVACWFEYVNTGVYGMHRIEVIYVQKLSQFSSTPQQFYLRACSCWKSSNVFFYQTLYPGNYFTIGVRKIKHNDRKVLMNLKRQLFRFTVELNFFPNGVLKGTIIRYTG